METEQQRKDESLKEYQKIRNPALKEYYKKCEEIENGN